MEAIGIDPIRLATVLIVGALMLAGPAILRYWRHTRLMQLAEARPFGDMIAPGKPAIIAFTTPRCHECRTRQKPALERLRLHHPAAIDIIVLDATTHGELVDRLGILTVPATVVVNDTGTVRQINLGYVDEHVLTAQLAR
jgi:hypothetical protein